LDIKAEEIRILVRLPDFVQDAYIMGFSFMKNLPGNPIAAGDNVGPWNGGFAACEDNVLRNANFLDDPNPFKVGA
jgi:hypothetical protein